MLGCFNPIQIWSNHNPTFGFVNILPKIGFRVFILYIINVDIYIDIKTLYYNILLYALIK